MALPKDSPEADVSRRGLGRDGPPRRSCSGDRTSRGGANLSPFSGILFNMGAVETVHRRGGAIVSGVYVSMAVLTITQATLRMDTMFDAAYVFQHQDLRRIRKAWRLLWPCLQIQHGLADQPRDLWFVPRFRATIVRDLIRLGSRVD
jgi:hypothetical protein